MKLISIIVPVYNAEKFLVTCLNSIIQQTYPALDIIIINDGSTDNSGQIAASYIPIDHRIRLFHQPNLGPGAARNLGMKKAKGDFIQFVDADDLLVDNAMEKLSQIWSSQLDLIIYRYEQNNQTWPIPIATGMYSKKQFSLHIGNLYKHTILASPCNKLYQRRIITKHQLAFPEDSAYGEDLLFNLSYLVYCEHIYLFNETLYTYKKHEDSITNSYIPNLFQKQKKLHHHVKNFLLDEGTMNGANEHNLYETAAKHCLYAMTNLFSKRSSSNKYEALKQILKDPDVKQFIAYFNGGFQARLCRFFIKYETTKLAYVFFNIKSYVKEGLRWRK